MQQQYIVVIKHKTDKEVTEVHGPFLNERIAEMYSNKFSKHYTREIQKLLLTK